MIKLKDILSEANIKHIDLWFTDRGSFYKTIVDKKKRVKGWDSWAAAQDSLSKLLGYKVYLRNMDDRVLDKAVKDLKRKGIKLTYDDSFDPS